MNAFVGKTGQIIKGKGFLNLFQFLKKLQQAVAETIQEMNRVYSEYLSIVEAIKDLEQLYPIINNIQLQLYKDIIGTVEGMDKLYIQEVVPTNPYATGVPYKQKQYTWVMDWHHDYPYPDWGTVRYGQEQKTFCNGVKTIPPIKGCMQKMSSLPTAVQNMVNYFGGYND